MFNGLLALIQPFQTLVAAVLSLLTAVAVGPYIAGRISERYAREREFWMRKLRFTEDLQQFSLDLRTAPRLPAGQTLDMVPKTMDKIMSEGARLYSRGRVLYPEQIEEDILVLLFYVPILPDEHGLAITGILMRYFESDLRGQSRSRRIVLMFQLIQGLSAVRNRLSADKDEQTGKPVMLDELRALQKVSHHIANYSIRYFRRWAIFRPWRWITWWKFERNMASARGELISERSLP